MKPSLLAFIWTFSRRDQFILIAATSLLFPLLYLTLELPKRIINDAISAEADLVAFMGFTFPQKTLLVLLCVAFLVSVICHGILKMRVNTMKGVLAERLLRRFRYGLIAHILRFPDGYRAKTSEGELVSMVTAETEPLGGIMGDAFAQPLLQAGQMITILLFLFLQSVWFGLAACAMIPLQAWLVPRLQREINLLNRSRIQQVRQLASEIGEVTSGAAILRQHNGWRLRMARTSARLAALFEVRFKIYKRKFFMKFLNNFLNQLTPFMLFLVGGLLVIDGELTVGALVAALSAFKDLSSPWKELLNFYTRAVEMAQRYTLVVERFTPPDLLPDLVADDASDADTPAGTVSLEDVTARDADGRPVLQGATLDIPAGSWVQVAVADADRAGLVAVLLRDIVPEAGRIRLGGMDVASLSAQDLARQVGYVTARPYLFKGTVGENIFMPQHARPEQQMEDLDRAEALRTGNSIDAAQGPWLPPLGQTDATAEWMSLVMGVGAHHDLLTRVLERKMALVDMVERSNDMAQMRREIRDSSSRGNETLPMFDPADYSDGLTLAENLMFAATAHGAWLAPETSARVVALLQKLGLRDMVLAQSTELAATLLEAFDVSAADSPVFRQLGIPKKVLIDLHMLSDRLAGRITVDALKEPDALVVLSLALNVPSTRFERAFRTETKQAIVTARAQVPAEARQDLADVFVPLDATLWHPNLTILDNLIFGKSDELPRARIEDLKNDIAGLLAQRFGPDALAELISALPTELRGENLSPQMAEVISLAQTSVKAPPIIILDNALASFEPAARVSVFERLRAQLPDATVLQLESEPLDSGMAALQLSMSRGQLQTTGAELPVATTAREASELQRKLDAVRQAPLFSGLSEQQLRMLAFSARWVDLPAGAYVFRQNDAPDGAYLIYAGDTRLTAWADDGSEAFSVDPEVGTLVGELGLIQNEPRRLDMRAQSDVTLLRIDSADFLSILENDARTAFKMIRVLIGYLDRN